GILWPGLHDGQRFRASCRRLPTPNLPARFPCCFEITTGEAIRVTATTPSLGCRNSLSTGQGLLRNRKLENSQHLPSLRLTAVAGSSGSAILAQLLAYPRILFQMAHSFD